MDLDKFERFISNSFRNVGQSFYDSYVEANVRFRSKLGMKQVIVRRQLGNCCKWCADLAGIYNSYSAPDDVFKRHTNCKCLVTYKTEEGYQDISNKKIFKTQRDSRIEKLKDLSANTRPTKYDKEKMRLKSQNINVYDATQEWNEKAQPNNVVIRELKTIRVNGIRYDVDGINAEMNIKPHEKEVLEKFVKTYGGILEYYPKINQPENIKSPDCLYNGQKYDLKQLGLKNPGCKGPNLLYNTLSNKNDQAHCYILDFSRSGLNFKEALEQARGLFVRKNTKYVKTIVLFDGKEFKILEKI